MRKYRFRAWDKKLKMMIYENEQTGYQEYDTNPLKMINMALDDSSYTFMQYTGLRDKNGEEICEGDIVKRNNRIGYISFLRQELGYVIVFKNNDIRLGHRNTGSGYDWDGTIEVLGNVYENQELLEWLL